MLFLHLHCISHISLSVELLHSTSLGRFMSETRKIVKFCVRTREENLYLRYHSPKIVGCSCVNIVTEYSHRLKTLQHQHHTVQVFISTYLSQFGANLGLIIYSVENYEIQLKSMIMLKKSPE